MNALFYITKRSFINKIKKAIHKPSAFLLILFWILYFGWLIWFLLGMTVEYKLNSNEGLLIILSYIIMFTIPSNIISYVRRKGIIFKLSDLHFLFNSPINPKTILIYRFMRLLLPGILMNIVLVGSSMMLFQLSLIQAILIFVFTTLIDSIFEIGLVVTLYADESLSEQQLDWIRKGAWAFLIVLVIYAFGLAIFVAPSLNVLALLPLQEIILCIPLFGWLLAPYHLILLGPSIINVITTLLYLGMTFFLAYHAYTMTCTGKYYEEAADFAKDYAERIQKSKKGQVSFGKKKYRQAKIEYKGSYAKALFYRQLLEYKKNRFFIFGGTTLLCLGIGVFLGFILHGTKLDQMDIYIIPGVSAYLAFLTSGYATKWEKELDKAYTFLIPDTAFKKLWYSTLVEHVRALVDGILLVVPVGIGIGLTIPEMVLMVIIHVLIMAIRLYCQVVCHSILGKSLGNTGISFLKMLLEGILIFIAVMIVIFASLLGTYVGLLALFIYCVLVSGLFMLLSANLFEKFEKID